ncbi:MAG: hypothetical protein H7244_09760 [Herminiimonas sp.]|nr:hypothetical protein [Herminiimonas sp.]
MHRIVNASSPSSTVATDATAPAAASATARPQHALRTPRPDSPHPQRHVSLRRLQRAGRPPTVSGLNNLPSEMHPLPPWMTTLDLSHKPKTQPKFPELPPSLRTEGVNPNRMASWAALITPKNNRLMASTETVVHDTVPHPQQQAHQSGGTVGPVLPGAFSHFTTQTTDALLTNLEPGWTDLAALSRTGAGFHRQLPPKTDADKKLRHPDQNPRG